MSVPFKVDLNGKVAVVTGGGGVLCGAMAKALAECGAAVAVADLKLEAAQRVADEITAAGGKAMAVACNALEKESLEAANAQIEATLGPVAILINGAGGNHPKGTTAMEYLNPDDLLKENRDFVTFYDLDPKGVEFVFNLNFLGTLLPTQAFTKRMALGRSGVVINVSSMNAFRPLTKIPAYSAAKAAVSNFTQWMAVHMAKAGIRVNAIAPGFFLTDQNRALLTHPDGSMTPRSEKILAHTPMGHFGEPADLIGALLWLVSDQAAGFVTGVVVPIDGGFSAYSGV
ncbi:MAG: SDR family oxidoreductase [Kiritimatiellia bacterium]|jgi:NAD(P)-dependent dehydrogenase (short-subunit alcohol dehydrogenase family)|nr:SDR family oxidoreductase [Kiritimatiellia bacterium]MDD4441818.1 SDR family oxidoreductase [Kiritimatiellia bacterium]MDX9794293.1 SDR family oxidoreductase [Kiritimatiellia bacterium]